MNEQILIPQAVAKESIDYLVQRGHRIKMGSGWDEQSIIKDIRGCEAVLLRSAVITRAIIESEPRLKIVARHGAAYDNVDIPAADEHGVYVTNCPLSNSNSVAECTIGLLLAASKRIMELSDSMRRGDFFYKNNHKGLDLEKKTLGIIGLGRIGSMVAKKAALGLDMKILAYDPYIDADGVPQYVTMADRDTVLAEADFLTLHLRLTDETRRSVGAREFAAMKKSAYLINCSRGGVVNEPELIEALRSREIAGAAIDVFDSEPLEMDSPLFSLDNAIVTPHIAPNTEECMQRMAVQAAMEIHTVLSGGKPSWVVNHPVGK